METITRNKIVSALISYDKKQSTRKGYNPYALPQYLAAVDNVESRMAKGYTLREAIIKSYLDRLCDAVLRALGLELMTKDEAKWGIR